MYHDENLNGDFRPHCWKRHYFSPKSSFGHISGGHLISFTSLCSLRVAIQSRIHKLPMGVGLNSLSNNVYSCFLPRYRHSWRQDTYENEPTLLIAISISTGYTSSTSTPPYVYEYRNIYKGCPGIREDDCVLQS